MISRRALIISSLSFYFPFKSIAKNNLEVKFRDKISSVERFATLKNIKHGDVLYLESYHLNRNTGGGSFRLINSEGKRIDNGIYFKSSDENLIWERITHGNIIKPEWYGSLGDGINDDGPFFSAMLNSISDGSKIILSKNAIYFNELLDQNSKWILNKNDIKIISQNSTLKRRGTYPDEGKYSYGNLSTLQISGENIEVLGRLSIDGGENKYNIVDKNGKNVSDFKYVRASGSSHALFIESSNNIVINGQLKCSNAVFPCYIHNSKKISLKGDFINSGQVYPVVGNDLQLGSCIKVSESSRVSLFGVCDNSAYSGCEIEPKSSDVIINVKTSNCLFYGVIIHDHSNNISLKINSDTNINGAALRISDGSYNIKGTIHVSNSNHALIISSFGKEICHDVALKVYPSSIKGQLVQAFNTTTSEHYLKTSNIAIYLPSEKIKISELNKTIGTEQIKYLFQNR